MFLLIFISLGEWLQKHMLACPSKLFLHIECPGCGMQRSFVALINGNFIESLQLHPALIPVMGLVIYAALHLKFNFLNGARNIKYLQLFAAAIVVAFYIYRLVNHQVFG